jgi:hypothetical protein
VVEHSIGNGEVDSSILSGSTSSFTTETLLFPAQIDVSPFRRKLAQVSHFGYFDQNER